MTNNIIKTTIIFSLLIMILMCHSCSHSTPIENSEDIPTSPTTSEDSPLTEMNVINTIDPLFYFDQCIYFYVGSSSGQNGSGRTLFRYNTQTEQLTTVCSDPLCTHRDVECPFYGMSKQFAIYDNKIFYKRTLFLEHDLNGEEPYSEIMMYDIGKSKSIRYLKTDKPITATNSLELYSDNYRFFYDMILDPEKQTYRIALCKMNIVTGTITILNEDVTIKNETISNVNMSDIMLFTVNNRLYFTDGKEIYSTDFDLRNRQCIVKGQFVSNRIYTDGEYIYWGESVLEDVNLLSLYRAKLDGSEKKALEIQTTFFKVTQNYIYYENSEIITLGKEGRTGSNEKYIQIRGTKLCRSAHDGSEKETVFLYQQGENFYNLFSPHYVGNYLFALYESYTDKNSDGTISDEEYYQSTDYKSYTILRIDLNTGEMDFIRCGTENRETP